MNRHHTVVDLTPVAVPLATDPHGLVAALGRARLVDATDRVGVGVLCGHDLLAPVSELLFIPLNQFQKALQRPRRCLKLQGNRFGVLAMQIRQLPLNIDLQQPPRVAPAETIGEQHQKQSQLPS